MQNRQPNNEEKLWCMDQKSVKKCTIQIYAYRQKAISGQFISITPLCCFFVVMAAFLSTLCSCLSCYTWLMLCVCMCMCLQTHVCIWLKRDMSYDLIILCLENYNSRRINKWQRQINSKRGNKTIKASLRHSFSHSLCLCVCLPHTASFPDNQPRCVRLQKA